MRRVQFSWLFFCICFITACTSTPAPPATSSPVLPATSAPTFATTTAETPLLPATPDFQAQGESLLSNIPKCTGMEILKNPIDFSWPNIEQVEGATWGYYSCDQSQPELAAFYRAQLPQAPYDDMEINWVQRGDGTVGVYYVTAGTYMYVWMLPQPDNSLESYAVVAIASEMIDC